MTSQTEYTQSPSQAWVSGTVAGTCTPLSYQMFYNMKNAKQNGKLAWEGRFMDNLVENFKKLNIGLGSNMAVQGALFGIQNAVSKAFVKFIGGDAPSEAQKVTSSALAGIVTSPIVNANEAIMVKKGIMTNEANLKNWSIPTYKQVFKTMAFGEFIKGLHAAAMREAGFVVAFSYLAPKISEKVNSKVQIKFVSNLIGGASAGAVGCFMTHPFDSMATLPKQGQKIAYKALWKGVEIRSFYGALAVTVYTVINEAIKEMQQ